MESQDIWRLAAPLEADTADVGDLALSRLRAMNDAAYPWLVLVPRRVGVTEVVDLDAADRAQLMVEISMVAQALKSITRCDKLNIGAIGNLVPQLHVHIVARRRGDSAWPKPVWGVAPPQPYAPEALRAFVKTLKEAIAAA